MKQIKYFLLNFGPQHPSAHGVLQLILDLEGEDIATAFPHIELEMLRADHKTFLELNYTNHSLAHTVPLILSNLDIIKDYYNIWLHIIRGHRYLLLAFIINNTTRKEIYHYTMPLLKCLNIKKKRELHKKINSIYDRSVITVIETLIDLTYDMSIFEQNLFNSCVTFFNMFMDIISPGDKKRYNKVMNDLLQSPVYDTQRISNCYSNILDIYYLNFEEKLIDIHIEEQFKEFGFKLNIKKSINCLNELNLIRFDLYSMLRYKRSIKIYNMHRTDKFDWFSVVGATHITHIKDKYVNVIWPLSRTLQEFVNVAKGREIDIEWNILYFYLCITNKLHNKKKKKLTQ